MTLNVDYAGGAGAAPNGGGTGSQALDIVDVVAAGRGREAVTVPLVPLLAYPGVVAAHGVAGMDEADLAVGARIALWVQSFLMRPHADLGRLGDVCPFTSQAAKIGTARIGVWNGGPDAEAILALMEAAVRAFDRMPCPKGMAQFKTIIIGFPNCTDEAGLKVLKQTQDKLEPHSVFRGKMIGFFRPDAPDQGLINPNFRPMQSPVPLLAIRLMVEGDAPFVVRHRRLTPIYLAKFPRTALQRLFTAARRGDNALS